MNNFKEKLVLNGNKVALKVKAKSPEILVATGVACIVGGTVMIAKSAMKHDIVAEEYAAKKADIEAVHNNEKIAVEYTDKDYRHDITIVTLRKTGALAKLYLPGITLTATGIACMLGAHNIMKKRNVALVAAYKIMESGFEDYRERVISEYGEEVDRNFKFGTRIDEIETEVINPETNRKNKKKEDILTVDGEKLNNLSAYSRLFDETNVNWRRTPSFNKMFLTAQQNYANDMLRAKGHVFLNEVYDMLGMERSSAGAVVGWVLGENEKDGYIDFGMFDVVKDSHRAEFINEREHSVMLDFNVDGVIYDLI